ncbi:Putidaredoxin reductase CamA [Pseudomonas sp. 9AZ]|uniref:NAD(P)/FAD-dependent oxidoreductase n=1 Tax=Pseudomonas sp. 9AZ TaxID=2653168 RepID=UPI0012F0D580|nr:FAD-dependent oxidoreductase [Pseudomonas sp. 9AZ]VXD04408.1 Putidaredoxin reductase CamA [Pseudomonas sp. 9AZ]
MSEEAGIVILGAGQAGGEVASELRKLGYTGRVTMIGDEPHLPYRRPPLSKAYFAGTVSAEELYVIPATSLVKAGIEFIGGVRVTHIDREHKQVSLDDGRSIAYHKLVIATGGRARPLTLEGANRPNVFLLRTIDDIERIRALAKPGARMVIIGGGFIGLETAAVALKLGLQVTVLEGLPRVLARVTIPEVSTFFERAHRDAGVDLRTGAQVAALEGDELVTHVHLTDGSRIEADIVVAGIGLIANTELAESAGLVVDNGVLVDEYACTSDPDIVAAGDCTNHPSEYLGRRIRLESVPNAIEQGKVAANSLMGNKIPYRSVPWFWSDQYDLKLQVVGICSGFDEFVVRGNLNEPSCRSFAVFYFKDGHLLSVDAVNRPQEFMLSKKLVAERARLNPAALADDSVPFKTLVTTAKA